MPRPKKTKVAEKIKPASQTNYLERLEKEIESNQSKVSLVLGALIILVLGILVFNYFSRNKPALGPAQQTQQTQQQEQNVSPDKLPGKYTVKEGDTLFTIAEVYYKDGEKFAEIAKENKLTNPDQIEKGQVLTIPKLENVQAKATTEPSATPKSTPTPAPQVTEIEQTSEPAPALGKGGGNSTIWGPRIEGNTYTVVEGDWLSKIAGRAYGDIMAYKRLAQVNNIPNPDLIKPGMVLKIPR